jgi:hypothetical protein
MKHTSTVFTGTALLVLLVLLPSLAFGQQNFQPAKVTTLNGDTLRGFIDYKGWDKSPKKIAFKADLQAPTQLFHPLDIKGFRVNNEQYLGSPVLIDDSSDKLEKLTESAMPIFRPDTAFLQGLVIGPRSLYRYKTAAREYLYTEQQGKFDLLVYKRFRPSNSNTLIQVNNTYRQQLATYLADCPAIKQRTQTLYYATSSVQKLFKAYYACTNQPAFLEHHAQRTQAGVLLGVNRTQLSFNATAQRTTPLPPFDSNTTSGPTGGLFFYLILPGSLGHFSFNNDLTYSSFKATGSTTYTSSADMSSTTSYSLALAYLKLNTLLRFTQPIGSGAIFINAGISNSYAFQTKNEQVVVSKFYSTQKTTTSEIFPIRNYEQGFVVGIGGSIKRLSAEARYERSNGFLDILNLSSSFERYSLLMGYRLH